MFYHFKSACNCDAVFERITPTAQNFHFLFNFSSTSTDNFVTPRWQHQKIPQNKTNNQRGLSSRESKDKPDNFRNMTKSNMKTEVFSEMPSNLKVEKREDNVKESKVKEEKLDKMLFDYKCSRCEYTSIAGYNMKRHLLVHSGLKPYSCHRCEYSCTAERDLRRHVYTHTGEKPFLCDQCNYSSTQACMLKRHRMMHNGERPFSCNQCEKSFKEKRDLKAHMYKEHNAERPFICSQCEYACTRADNLKRHEKTHANVKVAASSQIYPTNL